jgi:hypothetical protein
MKIAISSWGYCLTERPMPDSWVLPQLLEREGFALTSIRDPEAEVFIALDYSRNSLSIASKNVPRSRRLLIAFEPKAVNPAQHSRRVREKFAKSVVMSPLQILGESDQVLTLGALVPNEVNIHLALDAGSQRENAIVILNENKFSFVPGNNYKLRQLAIQELAKAGWQVHVGGANWTRGISWQIRKQLESLLFAIFSGSAVSLGNLRFSPRNWSRNITFHGRIPDGFAFMRRYKFALVIENDMSYVSEKLPNAILSGCVPVFVGPDLALHGIPGGVAISAKSEANHILKTFDRLGESTGFDVLSAGREWLCGPETINNFSHDVGLQRIVVTIKTFTQECMGK